MQSTGNFGLYNINKELQWSTETQNNPGSHIIAQDDGNVVIYTASKRPIWSTGTHGYTCPGMLEVIAFRLAQQWMSLLLGEKVYC